MNRFRFSSNFFGLKSRDESVAMCRRAENYGYDTIFAAYHLLGDVGSRMVGVGLGRAPVFTTASG